MPLSQRTDKARESEVRKWSTLLPGLLIPKAKAEPKSLRRAFGVPIKLKGNRVQLTVLQRGGAWGILQGFQLDNREGCHHGVTVSGKKAFLPRTGLLMMSITLIRCLPLA